MFYNLNKQIISLKKKSINDKKKMSTQEAFLNNLLDFSSIPSKQNELKNFHQTSTSENNKSVNQQQQTKSKNDRIMQTSTKKSQDKIFNNNQKLLKAFNTLRDKLGQMNRENIGLKENLSLLQKQLQEQKDKGSYNTNQVIILTKKLKQYEQQCSQYKLRLNITKQTIIQSQIKNQEIQKSKLLNQKLIDENKRLKEESKISIQLSLHEKLQLQQEIQNLKLKQNQLEKLAQQAQNSFYKKNNDLIHLQNQYKKLKLLYEEQVFLKTVDSQSVMLKQQNQQLKLINDQLMSKLKKEKNKKYQLQTKLLNLQEKVRLYGTKTDIYEGELSTALKKIKKVQKQNHQNKKHANQALNQKLTWEEKFLQSTVILEELISRVKRDLIGDVVELAKICQFRLNKLKNDQKIDFKEKLPIKRPKSSSAKKIRSESKRKISQLHENKEPQKIQENKIASFSNTKTNYFLNTQIQKEDFSKTVLKQRPHQNNQKNNQNLSDVKKILFNDLNTNENMNFNGLSVKNHQKTILPLSQISTNINSGNQISLQAKIRKQRQMMERKLRQKILYHKIQDAATQPIKNKLRQDYLNINFDF